MVEWIEVSGERPRMRATEMSSGLFAKFAGQRLEIYRAWLLCLALVGIGLFRQAGEFVTMEVKPLRQADLILCLGGDSGTRVKKAYELYREGLAPRFLLGGTEETPQLNRPDWLMSRGVPRASILLDGNSRTTWQEVSLALRVMRHHGWTRLILVSDPTHLRRLAWTCNRVFDGQGMSCQVMGADWKNFDAAHWWQRSEWARAVLSELQKLLFYKVVY